MQWSLFLLSLMGVLHAGMMGSSVRPVNLALEGEAIQSSTLSSASSAAKAINGLPSACSRTEMETDPWWRVDLLRSYHVSAVTITTLNAKNMNGAVICIRDSLEKTKCEGSPRCTNISGMKNGRQTRTFSCNNGPILGRYVSVHLHGEKRLSLCEVLLDTQVNVTMVGSASQSSTDVVKYVAANVIDGNKSSCAHTKWQANPWLTVDLLVVRNVTAVRIKTKKGCCPERLGGAEIRIGNSLEKNGTNNPRCAKIRMGRKITQTFHCDNGPMEGRYVAVFLPGNQTMLTLCEVGVYSTESPLVLVKNNKTWGEALDYCREHHYDLVSIHDEDTQSWAELEGKQANTPYIWLGLHYTCTLDFWFWVSGESTCYTNWAPGNGTGGEECGMTGAMERDGENRWVAWPDTERLNFICEDDPK